MKQFVTTKPFQHYCEKCIKPGGCGKGSKKMNTKELSEKIIKYGQALRKELGLVMPYERRMK